MLGACSVEKPKVKSFRAEAAQRTPPTVISESVLVVKRVLYLFHICSLPAWLNERKRGPAKCILALGSSQSSLRRHSGINIFRGRVAFIPRASRDS